MKDKTSKNKEIKDKKVFKNDRIFRDSEKYFYSGEYYKMSLKMRMFKSFKVLLKTSKHCK